MENNEREYKPQHPDAAFIEVYKDWARYGQGWMLCYREPGLCEYVSFTEVNSYKRTVLNETLMEIYKQGE